MSRLSEYAARLGMDRLELARVLGVRPQNLKATLGHGVRWRKTAEKYAAKLGCRMGDVWECGEDIPDDPFEWTNEKGLALLLHVITDDRAFQRFTGRPPKYPRKNPDAS